jgi:Ca2+/H+ antiporter
MLGTIGSYPDWLVCAQGREINQNDALIFYFFRNVMMAVLFITSIILYRIRHITGHSRKIHGAVLIVVLFLSAQRSYYRGFIPATRRC